MDNCIEDCTICNGTGYAVDWSKHPDGCKCLGCDEDNPRHDIRERVEPCPNTPRMVIDISDPREVALAAKYGFIVEAQP